MGYAGDRYALGNALPRRRGRALLVVALLTGWLVVGLATAGVGLAAKAGDGATNGGGTVSAAGESVSVNERLTRMELEIRQLRDALTAHGANLDNAKSNADKDNDRTQKVLDAYNNRVGDAHERISDIGTHITLATAIFTLALAAAGMFTYTKTVSKAKEEVATWLESQRKDIDEKTQKLISESHFKICATENESNERLSKIEAYLMKEANVIIDTYNRKLQKINIKEVPSKEVQEILQTPSPTFRESSGKSSPSNNIFIQAFKYYYSGDLENAAECWLNYSNNIDATDANIASALVNRGFTLGELKRSKEELETYDAVITRFGNDTEPGIREQVARALSNMSFSLLNLNEYDKAVTTIEEALRRYWKSDVNAFSGDIANAMVNRSAALLKLGRAPAALTGCDEILTRYKEAPDSLDWLAPFPEAMALKAAALDALDRHDEALTTCDAMMEEFGKSDDADVLEEVTKGLREAAERARARNDTARLAHYEETLQKLPQPN